MSDTGLPTVPTGNAVALGVPDSQDYPRLVFSAPYFETVAIAEIIQPSVTEAVENALPALVPPYVDGAVTAGIQSQAVLLTGSTMSGALYLNPTMPTQPSQAASMAYVDAMVATAGVPEVPPVPIGQIWGRETGQWVPIAQAEGTFLPLTGGTMQGQINMSGNTIVNMAAIPVMPNGAAPAQWVLNQIAAQSLYQGTWIPDTNTPDLTQPSTHQNGFTWIVTTSTTGGVVIGPAIPGLQGQTVFNGDTVIYSANQGVFNLIHAGGMSFEEAQALFLPFTGGQMSGALLLNANATQPTQAVTFQQLNAAVANVVTPDAPTDGQLYGRNGLTKAWSPVLPLAGGILTGALTLAANAVQPLQPVPLQQMTGAVSAAQAASVPLAGGTMSGPLILSGNAVAQLGAVPLQQLNAMVGSYLPLGGGTMTGPLILSGNAVAQLGAVPLQQLNAMVGSYLPLGGGTMTGPLTSNSNISTSGIISATGTGSIISAGNISTSAQIYAYGGGMYVQAVGAGNTNWVCLNNAGTQVASMYYSMSTNTLIFDNSVTGYSLQIGQSTLASNGYQAKSGISGAVQANVHNIDWVDSLAHLWIDSINAGAIAFQSDYRIKKGIVELPSMWATAKALRPIKYTQAEYTPDIAPKHIDEKTGQPIPMFAADDVERWGFVAHELQVTLVKSAATGEKDQPDLVQSPNPFTLLACITKALQEAMTRIEALEAVGRA